MGREFMSLDEVFSGNYSDSRSILKSLESFAESYAKIDGLSIRRKHNRSAINLLKQVFRKKWSCDEERVRTCYSYYIDKREKILGRENYRGDII